jgi:hypothetical protein
MSKQTRQQNAINRLNNQLKFGRTQWARGERTFVPVTDGRRDNIVAEINSIKAAMKRAEEEI